MQTYSERAHQIRKLAAEKGLEHLRFDHPRKGPLGEDLSIDVFLLRPEKEKILLHISGTHGAEGYLGSLVQERIIQKIDDFPKDQGLCIVHALNPFGMAWMRRMNHDNIDLNRNGVDFENVPESGDYLAVADFLEPQAWAARGFAFPKVLLQFTAWGKDRFASAVAGGQYERPRGIFYGGAKRSWELQTLENVLRERCPNLRELDALDVHSGLGPFNHEFLIADEAMDVKHVPGLHEIFKEKIHVPSPETGYVVHGSVGAFLGRAFPEARVRHITQEFGTFDTLTNVLCLVDENTRWHMDREEMSVRPQILKRVFFPENAEWRRDCVERGVLRFLQFTGMKP